MLDIWLSDLNIEPEQQILKFFIFNLNAISCLITNVNLLNSIAKFKPFKSNCEYSES